jgi:uncharacterized cupin superfamily protein
MRTMRAISATIAGLKSLGFGYSEVAPGKSSCPFHNHHVEDEMFVMLEGEGTYRFGMRVMPSRQVMCWSRRPAVTTPPTRSSTPVPLR